MVFLESDFGRNLCPSQSYNGPIDTCSHIFERGEVARKESEISSEESPVTNACPS